MIERSLVETMMLDASPETDESLRCLRENIEKAKSDASFIDDEGVFSQHKKDQHLMEVSHSLSRHNQDLSKTPFDDLAGFSGLDDFQKAAFRHAFERNSRVPYWSVENKSYHNKNPFPVIPKSMSEVLEPMHESLEKIGQLVTWWSQEENGLFTITYAEKNKRTATTETTVHMSPSLGRKNITTSEGTHSGLGAKFFNGRTVTVTTAEDGKPNWIEQAKARELEFAIAGYYGARVGKPEEVDISTDYSHLWFVGTELEGEHKDIDTNPGRFAARIALLDLADPISEHTILDIPLPSDEFCDAVLKMLSASTIAAILPQRQISRVKSSSSLMSGYSVDGVYTTDAPNLIRSATTNDLRHFVEAIGLETEDLHEEVTDSLQAKIRSLSLASRLDAIKALSDVDVFFDSLPR